MRIARVKKRMYAQLQVATNKKNFSFSFFAHQNQWSMAKTHRWEYGRREKVSWKTTQPFSISPHFSRVSELGLQRETSPFPWYWHYWNAHIIVCRRVESLCWYLLIRSSPLSNPASATYSKNAKRHEVMPHITHYDMAGHITLQLDAELHCLWQAAL